MKYWLIYLISFGILINSSYQAMSEKQYKAALKMIRNVCQPKFKVTDAEIDGMKGGKWDIENNVQCYLSCVLNMYKLLKKDNTLDYETAVKTIEAQAPVALKDSILATLTNCKDAAKTDDKCVASYELTKCFYFDNPPNYFLP